MAHMSLGNLNGISLFIHFCAQGWSGKFCFAQAGRRIWPIRGRHDLGRAVPRRTVQKLASGTEIEASSGRFRETVPRILYAPEFLSVLIWGPGALCEALCGPHVGPRGQFTLVVRLLPTLRSLLCL